MIGKLGGIAPNAAEYTFPEIKETFEASSKTGQSKLEIDPDKKKLADILSNVQGNVLRHHGRPFAIHVLLRFNPLQPDRVCKWLSKFNPTSAIDQPGRDKDGALEKGEFRIIALSRSGFRALGINPPVKSIDPAFETGMKERSKISKNPGMPLGDPAPESWHFAYQGDIHAVAVLAFEDCGGFDKAFYEEGAILKDNMDEVRRLLRLEEGGAISIAGVEPAMALWQTENQDGNLELTSGVRPNEKSKPAEHFGFVDGISRLKFFGPKAEHTDKWNPQADLDLVLTPETTGANCFGSYLVFRKLRQDVDRFDEGITRMAVKMFTQALEHFPNESLIDILEPVLEKPFDDGADEKEKEAVWEFVRLLVIRIARLKPNDAKAKLGEETLKDISIGRYDSIRKVPKEKLHSLINDSLRARHPKHGQISNGEDDLYIPLNEITSFFLRDDIFPVFGNQKIKFPGFGNNPVKISEVIDKLKEVAGGLVFGRLRDGTPLVPDSSGETKNNFNYERDELGDVCPFHAHIRRTNPRGDIYKLQPRISVGPDPRLVPGDEKATLTKERDFRIARRGMPYGSTNSERGKGLLFMSCQANLEQFELLQYAASDERHADERKEERGWTLNAADATWSSQKDDSPSSGIWSVGMDGIIGQERIPAPQYWPMNVGDQSNGTSEEKRVRFQFAFNDYVALKGGEYFYLPSTKFLAGLYPNSELAPDT